jgi:hypothetical protein
MMYEKAFAQVRYTLGHVDEIFTDMVAWCERENDPDVRNSDIDGCSLAVVR